MMRKGQILVLVTSAMFLLLTAVSNPAQASSSRWAPLAPGALRLGNVLHVKQINCSQAFVAGSTCYSAAVSCRHLPDIGVTFGLHPGSSGTIVFLTGGGGTAPSGNGDAPVYEQHGFGIAQYAFASDWEAGADDVLSTACRPATLLDYFYTHMNSTPFCAQGASAGSASLGYALAWYGLDTELDNAEMLVGPVLSNIEKGCQVPKASTVKVVPTNGLPFDDDPQYVGGEIGWLTTWTGQVCLPSHPTSQATEGSWAAQSIVQSSATLAYPQTPLAGWVCDNGLNPSAAQAYLFFSQVASPWTLTRLSGCTGAEGFSTGVTPQGVAAETAIEKDMLGHCVKRHTR